MGRDKSDVWAHFNTFEKDEHKLKRAVCMFCGHETTAQAMKCRAHLSKCRQYLDWSGDQSELPEQAMQPTQPASTAAPPPIKHKTYHIASLPGDGIGPEVISAGITVLQKLATALGTFSLQFDHFSWSSGFYKIYGRYIPDGGLEALKKYDAIYFGSVGDPEIPDHISLWSLRLALVQPLQLYANTRPTRILRGTAPPLSSLQSTPTNLNWLIIRENTEGEYAGQGGRTHIGQPWEVATEVAVFTRQGVERLMRFAFSEARKRPRKKLCVVTKSNAQRSGLVLWDEVAVIVSRDFTDVQWDKMLVDAMTTRMVLHPDSLDTIVATNLHADILSDLAASLAGSIGIAPTSNLDPTRKNPSMFEPIHGSAFDLVGRGLANPIGTFWTGSEMLRWLGEGEKGSGKNGLKEAADLLMEAMEQVTEKGIRTPDLGGTAKTEEVTRAVCEEIEHLTGKVGPVVPVGGQQQHGQEVAMQFGGY